MKSQKSSKSLCPTEVEHSREICSRETNQALLYVASSTKGAAEHHNLFESNSSISSSAPGKSEEEPKSVKSNPIRFNNGAKGTKSFTDNIF